MGQRVGQIFEATPTVELWWKFAIIADPSIDNAMRAQMFADQLRSQGIPISCVAALPSVGGASLSYSSESFHFLWTGGHTLHRAHTLVFPCKCKGESTAFQLAVDHAFTGSYARRFRPADPPETLTCPCGCPLRTPQHITRECPLYYQIRVNHAIHTHGRTIAYSALYNSHPHKLLSFLRDSRAASRPPDFGPPAEVAPEPD
jgi:hypothetical protein